MTDKTRENAPPLVKQIWEFLEEQLEVAEKRERDDGGEICHGSKRSDYRRLLEGACEGRTSGRSMRRTLKSHEILRFLSPCWEKKYMDKMFYAGNTIFEVFV